MQAAQSDRRRQRNNKKSANETISIITEWKDLNKWTRNIQREKKKKRKTNEEKMSHLELTATMEATLNLNDLLKSEFSNVTYDFTRWFQYDEVLLQTGIEQWQKCLHVWSALIGLDKMQQMIYVQVVNCQNGRHFFLILCNSFRLSVTLINLSLIRLLVLTDHSLTVFLSLTSTE